MKWISAKNKGFTCETKIFKSEYLNKIINLDTVISIETSEINNENFPIFVISFIMGNKTIRWYYKNQEERNNTYDKILKTYCKIIEI